MEDISLASLCGVSPEQFKLDLSVNSLNRKQVTTSIREDIASLVKANEEKRENKRKLYQNILKRCVEQMKFENIRKYTCMIYYVDDRMHHNRYYDRDECITYLIEKLRENNIDIFLLPYKQNGNSMFSKSMLYIDWKNTYYHNKSQFFTKSNQDVK